VWISNKNLLEAGHCGWGGLRKTDDIRIFSIDESTQSVGIQTILFYIRRQDGQPDMVSRYEASVTEEGLEICRADDQGQKVQRSALLEPLMKSKRKRENQCDRVDCNEVGCQLERPTCPGGQAASCADDGEASRKIRDSFHKINQDVVDRIWSMQKSSDEREGMPIP